MANYSTVCFIDSNVILEARPLPQLPWAEVDNVGPILVLITPTVLEEVDSKKRDGRLGTRAREFNRLVQPLASGGGPLNISSGPPQVDVALATCSKIPWDDFDDLDRHRGDDRLIAEILYCKNVEAGKQVLVSQDVNPLFKATRRGISTRHASLSWLPEPEPSAQQKEIARLKQQLADHQKGEPDCSLLIDIGGQPLTIFQVSPLNEEQAEELTKRIRRDSPRIAQRDNALLGGLEFDYSYDKRYDKFSAIEVPLFARSFHLGLEVLFNQAPIRVNVKNTGKARAVNLYVEVRAIGGWINEKPIAFPVRGMSPPRPKPSIYNIPSFDFPVSRRDVDRHEVITSSPRRAETFSIQCEEFRQGQEWSFDGVVWLDPRASHTTVVATMTASNLTGDLQAIAKIDRKVVEVSMNELVSGVGSSASLSRKPLVQQLIDEALQDKRYSDIEIYEIEGD